MPLLLNLSRVVSPTSRRYAAGRQPAPAHTQHAPTFFAARASMMASRRTFVGTTVLLVIISNVTGLRACPGQRFNHRSKFRLSYVYPRRAANSYNTAHANAGNTSSRKQHSTARKKSSATQPSAPCSLVSKHDCDRKYWLERTRARSKFGVHVVECKHVCGEASVYTLTRESLITSPPTLATLATQSRLDACAITHAAVSQAQHACCTRFTAGLHVDIERQSYWNYWSDK